MKFRVHMKDPDTLGDAIDDAVKDDVAALNLPPDESEQLVECRSEKASKLCSKWFEYGEYLTVEIDTDAGTCVVVPVK
jgi:hypothetical protein